MTVGFSSVVHVGSQTNSYSLSTRSNGYVPACPIALTRSGGETNVVVKRLMPMSTEPKSRSRAEYFLGKPAVSLAGLKDLLSS